MSRLFQKERSKELKRIHSQSSSSSVHNLNSSNFTQAMKYACSGNLAGLKRIYEHSGIIAFTSTESEVTDEDKIESVLAKYGLGDVIDQG